MTINTITPSSGLGIAAARAGDLDDQTLMPTAPPVSFGVIHRQGKSPQPRGDNSFQPGQRPSIDAANFEFTIRRAALSQADLANCGDTHRNRQFADLFSIRSWIPLGRCMRDHIANIH
jgi:hypothetical protein